MSKNFLASAAMAAMAALAMGLALPASANTLFFRMNPNIDTGGSRSVFVFGQAGSTGSITNGVGFSNNFTLGASGFAVIDLPLSNELGDAVVENKGFKIASESAISGYYLNRRTASTDMTYLIDGDRLGTDHVAVGYQNIRNDQISVQAAADNTLVTFRPTGGTEFQVTLNAGQTYTNSQRHSPMGPLAQSDGRDAPRLISEAVPCEAAMVEDVVVGFEDAVRQPVVAHELPDVLDRVELGAFRRQRQRGDVGRDDKPRREMPARLIEYQHGMGTGRDGGGYLGEVERHPFGIAAGQDERRPLALGWTDRAIDIGRRGALVLGS
jgi:hypothetical protein